MDEHGYGRRVYDDPFSLHSRLAVLESQMVETRETIRDLRAIVGRLESLVNRGLGAILVLNALGIAGAAWFGGHH